MFVKCKPKIVNTKPIDNTKTILWENFSPQGQPFSKTVELADIDLSTADTFYCDLEIQDTPEETLISVGKEIDLRDGNTYPRSIFHFLYVADDKLNIYMSARYKSGSAARRINVPVSLGGQKRVKIAFNANGIVVNGIQYTISYYNEWFNRVKEDSTRPLEIGSTYGNHSNNNVNYVVIYKKFMSIQEMQELTTI